MNLESKGEPRKRTNPAVGFGSSFAGGMAVFGLGGHWLDGKFDKEPLFTLLGLGLGLFYGGYELWKLITFSNREARRKEEARNAETDGHEADG